MGKVKCVKNFRCEICGILGTLQIISDGYARVRHYRCFKDGKPVFKYHRVSIEYVKQILEERQNSLYPIDQERNDIDLNLQNYASNNENGRAGSSVWHERLIRNQEVAGSNPARSTSL